MRKALSVLASALLMVVSLQLVVQAQTYGAIAGTVVDQNGAVVPNAVVVKGESGQEFTVTTSDNGTYRIPSVPAGIYTVSVTLSGFKKFIASNVKVDVGRPRPSTRF